MQTNTQTAGAQDYTVITELPGSELTAEQWARMHHRYALARQMAADRRVLEVACGAGAGLSALAEVSSAVVGGDYTATVLQAAHVATAHADAPVSLARFDAQRLPFAAESFDLVIIFEAIYYLDDVGAFLAEARRVLAPGGELLIGTANPCWPAFIPGPLSTRYWSLPELQAQMVASGFGALQGWGAFPMATYSPRQQQIARLRRYLVRHGLIPSHPLLRRLLQQLSYGNLTSLPAHLAASDLNHAPVTELDIRQPNDGYKVFYCRGKV